MHCGLHTARWSSHAHEVLPLRLPSGWVSGQGVGHVPDDSSPPLRPPRRPPEEVARVDLEAAVAPRVVGGALLDELDLGVELEPVGGEGRHLGGGEGRRLEDDEDVAAAGYHRRDGAAAAEPGI